MGDGIQMHVVDDDQFEEESAVLQNGENQISEGQLANLECLLRKNGIMNSWNERRLQVAYVPAIAPLAWSNDLQSPFIGNQ